MCDSARHSVAPDVLETLARLRRWGAGLEICVLVFREEISSETSIYSVGLSRSGVAP